MLPRKNETRWAHVTPSVRNPNQWTRPRTEYRYAGKKWISRWFKQPSFSRPKTKDTAGSDDWFYAALMNELMRDLRRLDNLNARNFKATLTQASAYGAWSCRYVGARGGMYSIALKAIKNNIREVAKGRGSETARTQPAHRKPVVEPICPACG